MLKIGYYLKNNKDVRKSGMDPLIHYLYYGFKEGRKPNSNFDGNYYLRKYEDVKKLNLNPLVHYSLYGKNEGRKTNKFYQKPFDTENLKFAIDDSNFKGIKTLFFSHDLKMQGAQNSLYELVTGLKEKEIVNPIIHSPIDGPLRNAYEKKGINVIIGYKRLQVPNTFESYNNNISSFIKTLESLGVEFIYSNTLRTFYGVDIAKKINVPSIWNIRESQPMETYFDYLPEDVKKIAYNCIHDPYKVIFVSKYTQSNWEKFNNGNFTVINNALNPERLISNSANWTRTEARISLGIEEDEIAIIQVGTISDRKGQKDLLMAIKDLPLDIINKIKIFFVGDTPSKYSNELHDLHTQLPDKIKNKIFIIPETSDENEFYKVVDYYLAADIFVFSSRNESYPRVILEALFFNIPIITTPVFGVKEQVKDEISALFYEPGNIEQLSNQLIRVINDDKLREKLKNNSKKRMEELSSHNEMLEKYGENISQGLKNKDSDNNGSINTYNF